MKSLRGGYLVRNLVRDYTKGGRKRHFKNKSPPSLPGEGGSREKPFTEEEKKKLPATAGNLAKGL